MKRLLETIKGIAKNTVSLIVTIVAFATAGGVGTAILHGKPKKPVMISEFDEDANQSQGTMRKISSVPRPIGISPTKKETRPPPLSPSTMNEMAPPDENRPETPPPPMGPPPAPIGSSLGSPTPNANPSALNAQQAAQQADHSGTSTSTSVGSGTDSSVSTDGNTGSPGDPAYGLFTSPNTSSGTSPNTYSPTSGISPSVGLWLGGTTATVVGIGFMESTPVVTIDSSLCGNVTVIDDNDVSCTVPPDTVGTVNVVVTNNSQTNTMTDIYTYTALSTVVTIAGSSGVPGAAPVGSASASSSNALFNNVVDVVASGTLAYIADSANYVIKQIDLNAGVVTVLAGNGTSGAPIDGSGTSAQLDSISALDINGSTIYYSTCGKSSTIRQVNMASSNAVSNIMGDPTGTNNSWADGNGNSAYANCIGGITHDSNNIYFADKGNFVIRQVSLSPPYAVTTLAGVHGTQGSTDGTAASATFQNPWGLTLLNGVLYIGDQNAIRVLNLSTMQVSTIAGTTTTSGFTDGSANTAQFYIMNPGVNAGLIRAAGNVIFVADTNNNSIREVTTGGSVTTVFGSPGASTDADGAIGSATTNGPSSTFYLPGIGVLLPNFTTLRLFY